MNKYAGLENVAWILVVIGIADPVLVLVNFFFRLGLIVPKWKRHVVFLAQLVQVMRVSRKWSYRA